MRLRAQRVDKVFALRIFAGSGLQIFRLRAGYATCRGLLAGPFTLPRPFPLRETVLSTVCARRRDTPPGFCFVIYRIFLRTHIAGRTPTSSEFLLTPYS